MRVVNLQITAERVRHLSDLYFSCPGKMGLHWIAEGRDFLDLMTVRDLISEFATLGDAITLLDGGIETRATHWPDDLVVVLGDGSEVTP